MEKHFGIGIKANSLAFFRRVFTLILAGGDSQSSKGSWTGFREVGSTPRAVAWLRLAMLGPHVSQS